MRKPKVRNVKKIAHRLLIQMLASLKTSIKLSPPPHLRKIYTCLFFFSLSSLVENGHHSFTNVLLDAWNLPELALPQVPEDSHLTNSTSLRPRWYYPVCQIRNDSVICFNHKYKFCHWLRKLSRAFWTFILFPKIRWTEIIWWWTCTWNWSGWGQSESLRWVNTYLSVLQMCPVARSCSQHCV